jgi:hypothetical protein
MLQLILESENEQNLKIIQELAEKLNIHCRVAFSKNKSESKKLFNSFNFHKSQQLSAGLKTSLSDALIEERREQQ